MCASAGSTRTGAERRLRWRQSISHEVSLTGIALHTGRQVRVRVLPAEPSTGIVFVRSDEAGLEIPATLDFAGPSFYATVLERDGVRVSTIEHLMAALYALQIDDARIELDGPEMPILDGSSLPFVEALLRAGPVESDVERLFIHIVRPLEVAQEEKTISVHPAAEYRVTYAIDFDHPKLGYQELTASLWGGDAFRTKLAPARTFTFEREVETLRKAGLALGGSLENAVVVGDEGILNPGLRFPDEFVRHKMLDLTGDLSLLGRPLLGHVVAYRAGHDLHARLARKIHDTPDAWFLAPWAAASAEASGA
jgi:UDP-3-O-[3-hydroxymyristoyl] N-acetylglucosamine deacetylase